MIWISFYAWGMYSKRFFVWERYLYKGHWTPLVYIKHRRYVRDQTFSRMSNDTYR